MDITNRDTPTPDMSAVTDEEREALRDIKYRTQLTSCHPAVVTAVMARMTYLLHTLKRPDLAEAWKRL